MHPRAAELVRLLELESHPEGGLFREAFRSAKTVTAPNGDARPAATHIYYLLAASQHSRWHRVAHDEIWNAYEGDSLELAWIAPDWTRIEHVLLGPAEAGELAAGRVPAAVVPGGCWQRARTLGAYSLAGCTVAPGFEFADFALLSEHGEVRERLLREFPDEARFLVAASS
jgi:uncharacterized protein